MVTANSCEWRPLLISVPLASPESASDDPPLVDVEIPHVLASEDPPLAAVGIPGVALTDDAPLAAVGIAGVAVPVWLAVVLVLWLAVSLPV